MISTPLFGLRAMFGTCLGGLACPAELKQGKWTGSVYSAVVLGMAS